MRYVIRSMSTTDARPGQHVVPYHIYLAPPSERAGAYWRNTVYGAQKFDTLEEAQEELARCQAVSERTWRSQGWKHAVPSFGQIVPEDHRGLPAYWEYRG
jgi:hypothetical protein